MARDTMAVQLVTIKVASCYVCPLCDDWSDDPAFWECQADDDNRTISPNLCESTPVPSWCPLRTGVYTVELEAEA